VSTESFHALPSLDDDPFGCTVHRRGRMSEIALRGELDLAARDTLEAAITTALEPGPVETVVVDMTQVTFADSTTVTWLLTATHRLRAQGGRLVTVVGPGPVRDVLSLTGLDKHIAVVPDARMR
jgi:anti-sigma B factor antagonist